MLRSRIFYIGAVLLLLCQGGLAQAVSADHPSDFATNSADNDPANVGTVPPIPPLQSTTTSPPPPHTPIPDLVLAAGPYARFLNIIDHAAKVPPQSAEDLEHLMGDLAGFDGPKLSHSFRAYAILQAMQTPAFSSGIQRWGRQYDRQGLIANLRANPAYVEQMPGIGQAREQVLRQIRKDGQAALLAGGIYKDLAYSLQRLKWASKVRGGKALRLAALRNAPYAPQTISSDILQPLLRAYSLQPPLLSPLMATNAIPSRKPAKSSLLKKLVSNIGPDAALASSPPLAIPTLSAAPAYAGELQNILANAALQILDPSTPYPGALSSRGLSDTMAECVDWARLHLNQCVAATRFVYEDSFCIARHQLKDSGRCIAEFIDGHHQATH
ncbi:MAG: hypothetical protein Q9M33_07720 [Robiginitomaculum sp.]|nr:hypothetical protein [Robiginitomaculum sp.]MDQ7078036.1 hypothetical protein [Robiginitomaculum sp.]